MILPLQLDLRGMPALLIGGGPKAGRWIFNLIESGAKLRVFAPELDFELKILAKGRRFQWIKREFQAADFGAAKLVVVAGEASSFNRKILKLALRRKLWTISADPQLAGNACLPPSLRRGGLLIHFALPGGMRSHPLDGELIQFFRRRLGRSFGREWELVWDRLKAWKGKGSLKERLPAWLKSAKKKRIDKKTL